MSNSIANAVPSNWQIVGFRWTDIAFNPLNILHSGEQVGRSVGREIARANLRHVHFIAHSAGAALIQAATIEINMRSPSTVIHATFLDPYLGLGTGYNYFHKYGIGSDWADQYFTSGNIPPDDLPFTGGRLENAYNVDVTDLNPERKRILVFASGRSLMTCYQPLSTHGWPIDFYTNTIPPNTLPGSEGLGFPLSNEGGDWQQTLAQYGGSRNNVPRNLGNQAETCVPGLQFMPTPLTQVLTLNRAIISTGGTVQLAATGFTASTGPAAAALRGDGFQPASLQDNANINQFGSPVWVAVSLTVTSAVNFISFDAGFTSAAGAAGLLSIYWDTNLLGVFDERVVLPGLTNYALSIPSTATSGDHFLGFRLDSYTSTASTITVFNVSAGFTGLTESFSLAFTGSSANGQRLLSLTGPAGYNYTVHASSNLIDWTPFATLVNTNGRVDFFDSASTNFTHRYYRAVAP